MTYTDTPLHTSYTENKTIINYFTTINQEEFEQTSALFTNEGQLLAPFAQPIVGRKAIAAYLTQEARGMQLLPNRTIDESTADLPRQLKVIGKVQTSLFTVNVAWFFSLNQHQQITSVQIKLLASPQELLGLKKSPNKIVTDDRR